MMQGGEGGRALKEGARVGSGQSDLAAASSATVGIGRGRLLLLSWPSAEANNNFRGLLQAGSTQGHCRGFMIT
jgi:hypothetical protein